MNDDTLRDAFHALTEEELPPDFIDRVLHVLPDRQPPRRLATIVAIGLALVCVVGVIWTVGALRYGGSSDASPSAMTPSRLPVVSSTPTATEAGANVVLSIEITPCCTVAPGIEPPNASVFALDGSGRAVYYDYVFGVSRSEARVAHLTPDQVARLIAFAIGPGGIADAQPSYERGSRGPSGHTIITLDSPELTKTVDYGLAPGNLVDDDDPTLGGLPTLVARLGHFSDDVERGSASGGLLLTEVDRAEGIALADPRFRELFASSRHVTDRVVPAPGRHGDILVYTSISGDNARWPSIDACEIGGSEGSATGVVWQIDPAAGDVVAVSLRWGDVDCLSG